MNLLEELGQKHGITPEVVGYIRELYFGNYNSKVEIFDFLKNKVNTKKNDKQYRLRLLTIDYLNTIDDATFKDVTQKSNRNHKFNGIKQVALDFINEKGRKPTIEEFMIYHIEWRKRRIDKGIKPEYQKSRMELYSNNREIVEELLKGVLEENND